MVERDTDPRSHAVIGAALEVHRVLGAGYLEVFFRDALAIEFTLRGIPFVPEVPCAVEYKGHRLRGLYRMDFLCFDSLVVEVKARFEVGPAECAQVISYLASSGFTHGLLLNFGAPRLGIRRFIHTPPRRPMP